jgi:hypothetical protein
MIILPAAYLPSIRYFAALQRGECVIDLGEHYVKRSERNRTEIMTSGGVMQLSVHLQQANRPRQAMRNIKIDYSKRWQHQHLVAMESAYRSSPYYDYYGERFAKLYNREWKYLVDLNMAALEEVCAILKRPVPRISEQYIEASELDIDLRPKKQSATFEAAPYIQVFSDRFEVEPRLSIYDLVMCEGPAANELLAACRL